MRRMIFWATITSGVVAAYLMYRRGEPVGSIAKKAIIHPIGSLVNEMKTS